MDDCKFQCMYLDETGDCTRGGGSCTEDDCLSWCDCAACSRFEDCED